CLAVLNRKQLVVILEQTPQTLREHLVIVGQKNFETVHDCLRGIITLSWVPSSGVDTTSKVPCSRFTRSAALSRPRPLPRLASTSNPVPESATVSFKTRSFSSNT